jgi:hypothetical protein
MKKTYILNGLSPTLLFSQALPGLAAIQQFEKAT